MATALGITTVVEPQVPLAELDRCSTRALAEGGCSSRVIAALFHPVGADAAFRARAPRGRRLGAPSTTGCASGRSSCTPTT